MIMQRPGRSETGILQVGSLGAMRVQRGMGGGLVTVSLPASGDTYIVSNAATTNFGTSASLFAGERAGSAAINRTLIKFDLSGLAGRTIVTATLRLVLAYVGSQYATNDRILYAYRVRAGRDWVTTQATWNIYKTGNSWTAAGCSDTTLDREPVAIGSAALQTTDAVGSAHDFALTPGAGGVQDWVDGVLANNGLLIRSDTEVDDMYGFGSSRHLTPARRPALIVTYQ